MFANYYQGRRVLVTGHTGFKGGWLSLWLRHLGAEVWGLALPPESSPCLHDLLPEDTWQRQLMVDIRDAEAVRDAVAACRPEFIFHLAAQPLVRRSYAEPIQTMAINVMGTLHVLEAIRQTSPAAHVLVITSDKCYENLCWDHGYRENDPLGGHDPYSMSKAACELAVSSWRRSFFLPDQAAGRLLTARAGNVIGGGDYCADRIVPDCIRSLAAGQPIQIRNPRATRPWQHVLDCLSGYLWLGASMATSPGWNEWAFNFGPTSASNKPVSDLVAEVLRHWPGEWQDKSDPDALHEASRLHLSTDKAAFVLGWQPTWGFSDAVRQSVRWYKAHQDGADMAAVSKSQIIEFCGDARAQGLAWTNQPS